MIFTIFKQKWIRKEKYSFSKSISYRIDSFFLVSFYLKNIKSIYSFPNRFNNNSQLIQLFPNTHLNESKESKYQILDTEHCQINSLISSLSPQTSLIPGKIPQISSITLKKNPLHHYWNKFDIPNSQYESHPLHNFPQTS